MCSSGDSQRHSLTEALAFFGVKCLVMDARMVRKVSPAPALPAAPAA